MENIKAPFKKLKWISNVKPNKNGVVSIMSEFPVNGVHVWIYSVRNFDMKGTLCKFIAHETGSPDLGEYDTIEEAIQACQKDFNRKVIEHFFEL
jgi:hypothetical protein